MKLSYAGYMKKEYEPQVRISQEAHNLLKCVAAYEDITLRDAATKVILEYAKATLPRQLFDKKKGAKIAP